MPARTPINIRQGNEGDCERVMAVLQAAFGVYSQQLDPPSGVTRETVDSLQEKIRLETMWLAEVGVEPTMAAGDVIGCIFAKPAPQNLEDLYFGRLGVLPAYQHGGIARQLIEKVEEQAREQGFARVVLAVRIALPKNVHYFQSLGYEITGSGNHKGYIKPTFYTMGKVMVSF